ncbi:MAG TPA: glutamine synthetase type III, partial [Spirochaetota bacterium]|nr:glutamine synthetase type III [Spirochaetota bacterium]
FAGINGSGKHLNWSLADDLGNNLLNPGRTPQDNIQFLVFLVATIRAVYHHADILRATIASSGNDHRLGSNEAPPVIISVFLGEQLTGILEDIEKGIVSNGTNGAIIDMGISKLPVLSKDNTDRNRTSPFAFTGNKFEFRAVGASQSISFPATVLNTIVAESLDILAGKIAAKGENLRQATLDVLKDEIGTIKRVLFMGDNYSKEWEAEAGRRGLPNKKTSYESLPDLATPKAVALFEKYRVLSSAELMSRYQVRLERYVKEIDIEAGTLCDMVDSQVLPAAIRFQGELASSILSAAQALGDDSLLAPQRELLASLTGLIGETMRLVAELKGNVERAESLHSEEEKAAAFGTTVRETIAKIRSRVDAIELVIDDEIWPLPRFWEMLFIK